MPGSAGAGLGVELRSGRSRARCGVRARALQCGSVRGVRFGAACPPRAALLRAAVLRRAGVLGSCFRESWGVGGAARGGRPVSVRPPCSTSRAGRNGSPRPAPACSTDASRTRRPRGVYRRASDIVPRTAARRPGRAPARERAAAPAPPAPARPPVAAGRRHCRRPASRPAPPRRSVPPRRSGVSPAIVLQLPVVELAPSVGSRTCSARHLELGPSGSSRKAGVRDGTRPSCLARDASVTGDSLLARSLRSRSSSRSRPRPAWS